MINGLQLNIPLADKIILSIEYYLIT